MGKPFSSFKLRFCFFIGAIICQTVAPLIPAFDTSHLVPLTFVDEFPDPKTSPFYLNHDSAVDKRMDNLATSPPQLAPSTVLRWDTLHYLDVALYGTYAYEHQYAFSLGVPIVLRIAHWGKELFFKLIFPLSFLGTMNTQIRSWVTVLINTLLVAMLAAQPCLALYRLSEKISHSKEFSYLSLIIHALMGAPPVIIRSAYAEPFFAWFTFEGLNAYHEQNYFVSSLYFGLATAFRTNGILLPCFILYDLLARPILSEFFATINVTTGFKPTDIATHLYRASRKLKPSKIIYGALLTMISLSPFLAQQYLAYLTFCQSLVPRPWCDSRIPLIYSFVQSHYWDVGLWRYWTIAQIPNFLLATPILTLAFASIAWFAIASSRGIHLSRRQDIDSPPLHPTLSPSMALVLLPCALHALVISIILLTAAHVQIALRVLPAATPWVSWAGAALIIQGVKYRYNAGNNASSNTGSRNHSWWPLLSDIWIGWSVIWLFISSILWLAFLPPA
ncbi:unnamed protein product [Rhizoctonia solani]|uniref:GPI mannosyltransferase 2 n=1 Tax=Rhizoctonia solani TaxID=456999 RepID=A0A8H2XKR9_9AGAM|nr:unnamed protein product [Rhizoctonia solani]